MVDTRFAVLALVGLLLVAGCSAPSTGPENDAGTSTPASQTETATTTATATPSPTDSTFVMTAPGEESSKWTEPKPPKDPEDKRQDRISKVEFVNSEAAGDGAVSNFDLEVTADTMMKDVDPTPDVDGEPYFTVVVNGQLIDREEVNMREDGSFVLTIHSGALGQFDAGTLDVRVTMYDVDHYHDDRYDVWEGSIDFQPAG